MAAFVAEANGYIIDVPVLIFTPDEGDPIVFDRLTSASVSNGANNIPINGGWSNFPLAIIDTDKTLEFTFECADFDQRLFAVANGTAIAAETEGVTMYDRLTVSAGLTISIPATVVVGSIKIAGFELAEVSAAGKFTVTPVAAAGEVPASTTVTFFAGDVVKDDVIEVVYQVAASNARKVTTYTDASSVIGSMKLIYPVYAGADVGSGVIGKLIYTVYKARATALPGFNNSYKSASTFGATFTGLDPRRSDKAMTKLSWFPNA